VVEYNAIKFENSSVETMTPAALAASGKKFDAAFSFSSFEHDGLGRYGDRIDPEGDLKAMADWKTHLKPGALLYLTVPLGKDKIIFNVHRIYGRARLPLLLANWDVVDAIGLEDSLLDRDTGNGWRPRDENGKLLHPGYQEYSPVFVLRNA
jgi:hypothetical protein